MRARTNIIQRKDVRKEVVKEFKSLEAQWAHEVAVQTTALIFFALETEYGFKSKRLKKTMNAIKGIEDMSVLGRKYDVTDIIKHFQEMGIDLAKEVETKVVTKE